LIFRDRLEAAGRTDGEKGKGKEGKKRGKLPAIPTDVVGADPESRKKVLTGRQEKGKEEERDLRASRERLLLIPMKIVFDFRWKAERGEKREKEKDEK